MKPETRLWIKKAEDDYDAALVLWRSKGRTKYDQVCFHAQQCAEKYIKAALVEHGVLIDSALRTHDLSKLLARLSSQEHAGHWGIVEPQAEVLSEFGVRIRYPGKDASRTMAITAIKACELIREHAANPFNLDLKRAASAKPGRFRRATRYRRKK